MTRVLYWNIENFGYNKIRPFTGKRTRLGAPIVNVQATDRFNLIIKHINSYDPDIFVIIEVSTGIGAQGGLISQSGGWDGCELLLNDLINIDPSWNLVPPLLVGTAGRSEGVAVFYKSQIAAGGERFFTGPNRWGGPGVFSFNPIPAAAPPVAPVVYPPYVDNLVWQAPRLIPGAAQFNGGQQEDQMAARTLFATPVGGFGVGLRTPYMTTFCETNAGGAVQRNLTLFAVHSPPRTFAGIAYIANMALNAEIIAAPIANETKIIVGDFNVNLLNNVGADLNRYAPLTAAPMPAPQRYTSLMVPAAAPAAGGNPSPLQEYKGFFATHMKSRNQARFWSLGGQDMGYPGYSYTGSGQSDNTYSIDNILVNGGGGAAMAICNSVVGAPLDAFLPTPGGAPDGAGVGGFGTNMAHDFLAPPIGGWPIAQTVAYALGDAQRFRGWSNFRHIRSTSDHLALFATV